MAGYYERKMSNNAVKAYNNGEMPLSKWSKSAILEAIAEIDEEKAEMVKKMTKIELKESFLTYTAWHHTSCHFNVTNFYEISQINVEKFTKNDLEEIIKNRKPRTKKRAKEVIEAEKAEKAKRQAEKAEKAEKQKLFFYQKKYKTFSGFLRSSIDFEKLKIVRKNAIEQKREELRTKWVAQNCSKIKYINDDVFIESYIIK